MPEHGKHPDGISTRTAPYHGILLVLTLVPIVLLAKKLAILVDKGTSALNVPNAAGGILIAILVLAPEGLAAARLVTGTNVVLGLDDSGVVLLMTTLLVSVITFAGPRTSILQGVVHLVIFVIYVTMVMVP